MDPASAPPPARTIDDIIKDYRQRRSGVICALDKDVELFFAKCDPEKDNLCLYGLPDGTWDVSEPPEEVPSELPEPTIGINYPRDWMPRKDWLTLVAMHTDWWLLSVAYCQALSVNRNDRRRLLNMINDLPTLCEVVTAREMAKDKTRLDSESKPKLSMKRSSEGQIKDNSEPIQKAFGQDEDSESLCGICGGNGGAEAFWIWCDICERWFHGNCVQITPAMAESIGQYKCPRCSSKKSRK